MSERQKILLVFIVMLAFAAVGVVLGPRNGDPSSESANTDQTQAARRALAYLEDNSAIPEVRWLDVDGNNLYVGFDPQPVDLWTIMGGAALNGNRAIDFGFHVWAVDARVASQPQSGKKWRPGDPGWICTATARKGFVKSNDCPGRP